MFILSIYVSSLSLNVQPTGLKLHTTAISLHYVIIPTIFRRFQIHARFDPSQMPCHPLKTTLNDKPQLRINIQYKSHSHTLKVNLPKVDCLNSDWPRGVLGVERCPINMLIVSFQATASRSVWSRFKPKPAEYTQSLTKHSVEPPIAGTGVRSPRTKP